MPFSISFSCWSTLYHKSINILLGQYRHKVHNSSSDTAALQLLDSQPVRSQLRSTSSTSWLT